jgi:PAS domain S-box-containing protein
MSAGDIKATHPAAGSGIPLHAVYDALDHGVAVIDTQGRFVSANRIALQFMGFNDLESLLSLSIEEIRGAWDLRDEFGRPLGRDRMPITKAMKERRKIKRLIRATPVGGGKERWLSIRAVPLLDEAGHVKAVVVLVSDTTEIHVTSQRLRDSEARFRDLVEATNDLVSWTDMEGRVLYVNSMAQEFLGREPDEIIGEDGLQHLHPDDIPGNNRAFSHWMEQGGDGALTMEYRMVHKDGGIRRVSAQITVARDARGHVVGVRNISRDITKEHAEQEALEAMTAALERAVPIAEAGFEALPELVEACDQAINTWNGSLPLAPEDPVVRLLDVGGRLVKALQRSLKDAEPRF